MRLLHRLLERRGLLSGRLASPVRIAFAGSQVVVRATGPEVIAGVQGIFREMLAPQPGPVAGQLEVQQNDGGYQLLGGTDALPTSGLLSTVLHAVKHQVALQFIRARSDLVWFHASAAASQGRAVVFMGAWGHGKSSLVAGLCAQGWTYLADDVVALDPRSLQVLPYPEAPMVREDPGHEIALERLNRLNKVQMSISPWSVAHTPLPLCALVFPAYDAGTFAQFVACSPANTVLALVSNCLNFAEHSGTMAYFCDVLARLPASRLAYTDRQAAVSLIAQAFPAWLS